MLDRKIGKFFVSQNLVKNYLMLADILGQMGFVPLRVEYYYANATFEYVGISKMFDEVKEGEQVPEYLVKISNNKVLVEKEKK